MINQPCLKERYYSNGINSFLNNDIIKTSDVSSLADAILSYISSFLLKEIQRYKIAKLTKYQKHGGYFTGGDAYQYAILTSGHIDIVIESGLKPHDFLSLVPLIEKAGGIITDWDGNKVTTKTDGKIIATANPKLHKQVLENL